ncbi:phorbol esters/diacylglycerol binding domain protein, partial [Cooperia oncophora]
LYLDGHFDRPAVASVLRTESDRVPHVLVSQASTDLRRTRSESQLVKALDSISISSSVSGGMEDEIISVYTLSSLGSEPTGDQLVPTLDDIVDHDGTLTPSVLTPRAKDDTLTPGMTMASVEKEVAAAGLVPPTSLEGQMAESVSSIASSLSLATEDGADEDGGLNRNRPSSTRKQRLHVALQASKRKVLDLMQKRRPVTPSSADNVEMGADAGDLDGGGTDPDRESPLPSNGKHSPVEMQVVDKKEKRKKSKNRSPSTLHTQSVQGLQDSPTSSVGYARSKTTKSVHFRENVLWGQSLHYELDGTFSSPSKVSCKYLNITVHAKEAPTTSAAIPTEATPGSTQAPSVPEVEPPKPILLGYTSLYVPQILDDCQLTLSNCHREVYQLKPPTGIQSINEPSTSEFSRHAGHDPRLCYGDVTIGFRFFPGGLPQGAGAVGIDESDEELRVEEVVESAKASVLSSAVVNPTNQHEWKPWTSKSGSAMCSMCRGKIWLKSASRCQRCLVVCHHKCVEKAASGIACTPHAITQADAEFAELDVDVNEQQRAECPTSVIPATPQTTQPPLSARAPGEDVELTSRRTRLRNKMTEKFSSWRRGGKMTSKLELDGSGNRESEQSTGTAVEGEALLSPMASIQDCLAGCVCRNLKWGSPFIGV